MNKEWKLNIKAFLLSAIVLLLGIVSGCVFVWIFVVLINYLPYVGFGLLLFSTVCGISIPIREYLIDRENANQ